MADPDHSTSPSSVSRRALLAGAAATPLIPLTAPQAAADPVVPLWQEWRRRQARAEALCQQWQALETRLMRSIGYPRVRVPAPEKPDGVWAGSHDEIDRIMVKNGGTDEVRGLLHVELAACQKRWNAAAEAVGFDRIKELEIEASDAQTNTSDAMFMTPAVSLAGVEAKLAVLVALCETGADDPEFPCPQLRSTLADVKRLRRESAPSRR